MRHLEILQSHVFLVNSRLDHFSAPCLLSEGPLLPKLRGQFAEFLSHDSLEHLGILSLPTCVGLRYGLWQTGPPEFFSGVWLPRLSDRPKALRTVGVQQAPSLKLHLYLLPSTGYSVSRRACHNSVTPLILPQVTEY